MSFPFFVKKAVPSMGSIQQPTISPVPNFLSSLLDSASPLWNKPPSSP